MGHTSYVWKLFLRLKNAWGEEGGLGGPLKSFSTCMIRNLVSPCYYHVDVPSFLFWGFIAP